MSGSDSSLDISDIEAAKDRLSKYLPDTPVFRYDNVDEKFGRRFYFKAENLQKTGSFKVRGALNASLLALERDPSINGFVTHSSGNHGRSMSWLAQRLAKSCVVVCPTTVPEFKLQCIRDLGAEIVISQPSPVSRLETTQRLANERNLKYISTCDDADVIAGQGTICLEFLKQVPQLDAILIPVSGGGMAAGSCITVKALKPEVKIYIVEPEGKDLERNLRAGERLWSNPPKLLDTLADGMRMQQLGQKTWPIILKNAEKDVITVTDSEIVEGMKLAFTQMKLVIESSAGAAVAAIMSDKIRTLAPSIKNIGVILCGGNLDIDNLPWCPTS